MNQQTVTRDREKALYRYIRGVDAGDLDEIAEVLRLAESDPILNQLVIEINQSYAEELGLASTTKDAETVRALARQHFASTYQEGEADAPLTMSEVTARMVAERSVPPSDQETGRKLLATRVSLPDLLSLAEIRRLAEKLRFSASDRFWKAFRETALQMTMGRGEAQMVAARRKRRGQFPESHKEDRNAE